MSENNPQVIICGANFTSQEVIDKYCPTCKKTTRFLAQFEEWYGWLCTCLECGDQWRDGELVERPFAPGWRRKRIERAMKRVENLRGVGGEETENQV